MAQDYMWFIYDEKTGDIVQPAQQSPVRKWTNLPTGCKAIGLPIDDPVAVKLKFTAITKGTVKSGQLTTKP